MSFISVVNIPSRNCKILKNYKRDYFTKALGNSVDQTVHKSYPDSTAPKVIRISTRYKIAEFAYSFCPQVSFGEFQTEIIYLFELRKTLDLTQQLKPVLRKCINENYRNGLLTKTEAVCIDNCVKKYLEFNHHVTIHLRELQEPQTLMQFEMQQQELGRQMGL